MAATAHLIHGFVGAGKTTFARTLEQQLRAVRFTHDEWMHRLYGPVPPADRFADLWAQVNGLIWERADPLLRRGEDVILDMGFWSRASRGRARQRVAQTGARSLLYHVVCPESVMRARTARRNRDVPGDSLWINEQAFDEFRNRFQSLGQDEEHQVVDGLALTPERPERR